MVQNEGLRRDSIKLKMNTSLIESSESWFWSKKNGNKKGVNEITLTQAMAQLVERALYMLSIWFIQRSVFEHSCQWIFQL
jgi:hypothetical protein